METERLERMPVLEKVGMGEAEHTAGVPVTGHHCQTTMAVTFFGVVREQSGGKCGFPGFLPPVSDDVKSTAIKPNKIRKTSLIFIVIWFV